MIDPNTVDEYLAHAEQFVPNDDSPLTKEQGERLRTHLRDDHKTVEVFTPSFWTDSQGRPHTELTGRQYTIDQADIALLDYHHWEEHGGPMMDSAIVTNHEQSRARNAEWLALVKERGL